MSNNPDDWERFKKDAEDFKKLQEATEARELAKAEAAAEAERNKK